MNGPQDLGGRHGFGEVQPEDESIRFHAAWEKRVLGLTLAAGGARLLEPRRLAPCAGKPAAGHLLQRQLLRDLAACAGGSAAGRPERSAATNWRRGMRRDAGPAGGAVHETRQRSPGFCSLAGPPNGRDLRPPSPSASRVRSRNHQPAGHTRLPGYARGHVGTITAIHGCHVFPDSNAQFAGESPRPLYTVSFEAAELYGEGADPKLSVSIEAWEPYLDRA